MDIFPQGVRVVLGDEPQILNLETGEQITGIRGIVLEYDAAAPHLAQLILAVHPSKMQIESTDTKFEFDTRTLMRLAEQNGFKLVQITSPASASDASADEVLQDLEKNSKELQESLLAGNNLRVAVDQVEIIGNLVADDSGAVVGAVINPEIEGLLKPFHEEPQGFDAPLLADIDDLSDAALAEVGNVDMDQQPPLGSVAGAVVTEHAPGTPVGGGQSILAGGVTISDEMLAENSETIPKSIDTSDARG